MMHGWPRLIQDMNKPFWRRKDDLSCEFGIVIQLFQGFMNSHCYHETPANVWLRIHVDIDGPINGQFYLVAVDARSKCSEVWKSLNCNTSNVPARLDKAFAR
ncbi:hypothetical protein GJ496_008138 [Pomphorhynchus laevis]|nr:hypothetical protein GJ496_008138 [Pomphorhynchus laevis]